MSPELIKSFLGQQNSLIYYLSKYLASLSFDKIISKFVAKLLLLTFLGLPYRDVSLMISYLVVIGISIQKSR